MVARSGSRPEDTAQDDVGPARACAPVFVFRVDIFAISAESTRPSHAVHSILGGVCVAYAGGAFTVRFRFASAENRGAESAKNLARKAFAN